MNQDGFACKIVGRLPATQTCEAGLAQRNAPRERLRLRGWCGLHRSFLRTGEKSARRLHSWLGPKWAFSRWIAHRLAEYGFEEGADFYRSSTKTGGRPRIDYLLTLDTAKELAMVERTEVGREARQANYCSLLEGGED